MISKENSVHIFDAKIFIKNTQTDENHTCLFKKHEIYSAAYFHMTTLRRSKDVIFHDKNIHKIPPDLFRKQFVKFLIIK